MTISEKILRAKNDYNSVYEAGKASMIDPDKIIEKTATGTGIVAFDDVSELPHDITVQLTGDNVSGKEVTVYGKNLLDQSQELKIVHTNNTKQYYGYSLNLPTGRYTISAKQLVEDKSNVYIYVPSGNTKYLNPYPRLVTPSEHRALVVEVEEGKPLAIYDAQAKGLSFAMNIFAKFDLQVEAGGENTTVEPYIQPVTYTANADGKIEGIKSISPNMTFFCEGVDISVDYRADWGIVTSREKQWNGITNNGNRTSYPHTFGYGYNRESFFPMTDLVIGSSANSFSGSNIIDLSGCFARCGTKLDTSKATSLHSMFLSARTLIIPEISLVGITASNGTTSMFSSSEIAVIENLIFKDDGTTPIASNMFTNASNLKEIRTGGVIGQSISYPSSPLSRASMDNIFEHLKPFGTVWTETTNTSWKQDPVTGAYPCDKVKVVVSGLPDGEVTTGLGIDVSTGYSGDYYEFHVGNGEYDVSEYMVSGDDNLGSFGFTIPHNVKQYLTFYEGIIHEESATPSAIFKQSAVDAAYTKEEWDAKVLEARNKGWTIKTVSV